MAGLEESEQSQPLCGTAATCRGVPGAAESGGAAPDAPGPLVLDLLGDPSVDEVPFPSRPESAGAARRLTHRVLHEQWGLPPHLTENAVLLVSELVGNAVRHTGARRFGLRMLRRRGWIRIEVRDPSRGLPCLMPVRELDISGRGLFLVETLSDRWGVDLLPRGKTTWFEMRTGDR
ncbi:ATP-binding protein [Streptomyces catenulae]|uniref:ATP-binding protein n=1 Tax=Streptomyces catenulae TaxID=66875 RepID=A0ABV2YV29_9ACTN|nr:ATP-binding protein [Streptomyces catenulae]